MRDPAEYPELAGALWLDDLGPPSGWVIGTGKDWTVTGDRRLLRCSYATWTVLASHSGTPRDHFEGFSNFNDDMHYVCSYCHTSTRGPKKVKRYDWDLPFETRLSSYAGHHVCPECLALLRLARNNYFEWYSETGEQRHGWLWHLRWWAVGYHIDPTTERKPDGLALEPDPPQQPAPPTRPPSGYFELGVASNREEVIPLLGQTHTQQIADLPPIPEG